MTVKDALNEIPSPTGFDESIELEEILTNDFIQSVTDCSDADELFAEVDFDGQQQFDSMDVAALDQLIAKHSSKHCTFVSFIRAAIDRHYREDQS